MVIVPSLSTHNKDGLAIKVGAGAGVHCPSTEFVPIIIKHARVITRARDPINFSFFILIPPQSLPGTKFRFIRVTWRSEIMVEYLEIKDEWSRRINSSY